MNADVDVHRIYALGVNFRFCRCGRASGSSRRGRHRLPWSALAVSGLLVLQVLPGLAAAHARGTLGDNIRASSRVLVADLDQNPAALAGLGQTEPAGKLAAIQGERQMPQLIADDLGVPSSQMITAPLPRDWPS